MRSSIWVIVPFLALPRVAGAGERADDFADLTIKRQRTITSREQEIQENINFIQGELTTYGGTWQAWHDTVKPFALDIAERAQGLPFEVNPVVGKISPVTSKPMSLKSICPVCGTLPPAGSAVNRSMAKLMPLMRVKSIELGSAGSVLSKLKSRR